MLRIRKRGEAEGAGETAVDGQGLSDEEIASLAFMANNIDEDERSLEQMIEDGEKMLGSNRRFRR